MLALKELIEEDDSARTALCPQVCKTTWNYQNICHKVYIPELIDFIFGTHS